MQGTEGHEQGVTPQSVVTLQRFLTAGHHVPCFALSLQGGPPVNGNATRAEIWLTIRKGNALLLKVHNLRSCCPGSRCRPLVMAFWGCKGLFCSDAAVRLCEQAN